MKDRITLVAIFSEEDNAKIKSKINLNEKLLCKVPYRDNITDRKGNDTLPYHFTFCAWNIHEKDAIINNLKNIAFKSSEILVNDIDVMNSINGGFVLYFNAILNEETKEYQKQVYNIIPMEKYNPKKIKFHITIHVDKDYDKICKYKESIKKDFEPFEIKIKNAALYEIYPATLITKF